MTEEKTERPYPIKSLHGFLSELDREWDKFRMGSLVGMVTSSLLLVFLGRLLLLQIAIRPPFRPRVFILDTIFMMSIIVLLIYSIYALYAQYRFFKKWERRIGLLLHLEEELMGEKLKENPQE